MGYKMKSTSSALLHIHAVPLTGEGNWGSLSRAPSVRGTPNSAELFKIRSCSSFTSQCSFFKRFVSLDSSQPAFLLHAHAADANFKIMQYAPT